MPTFWGEHVWGDGTPVKAWALMQRLQPKAEATSPDKEGPGDPPSPDTLPILAVTHAMPSNPDAHRTAEVDLQRETRPIP